MRDVNVGRKFLAEYQSIIFRELLSEIEELAAPLQGKRVLHVNATSFGGGVAEILYTLLPLMNDVGLQAEWQVMTADSEFFNVTKAFHNGLQGAPVEPHRRRARHLRRRQPAQRRPAHGPLRLRRDPRPAALRHAHLGARRRRRHALDLALPHRHLYARPGALRLPAAVHPPLRPGDLHDAPRTPPDGLGVPLEVVPARDRPAGPQEHDAGARRRPLHRAAVRHRRRSAAAPAGLALRPLEGPARRGRRLPVGERAGLRCSSP